MMRRLYFLLLAFLLSDAAAWAEQNEGSYTRLARLSYIEGQVSYQHIADVEWSAASINLPLEPGDRIYTGQSAKAEIEFEDGSIFRMAGNTDIEILSQGEEIIQVRILVGLACLVSSNGTNFEIDTPAAAFNTLRNGNYRFGVQDNGDSEAVVRTGELEAANNNFSRRIAQGEAVRVPAAGNGMPEYSRYDGRDEWDEWNDRRNADMDAYADSGYLPANVYIGAYDLNRHGRWVNVGMYGSAWVPYSVDVYWTPYSLGRWCYRPIFGWTWVSYEPWGWLPYHYGRWYRSAVYGWCWLPGPSFTFNFWSPALVSFYSGPGWVSWCPLGPGDYYNVGHYHYNHRLHGHYVGPMRAIYTRSETNHYYRYDRDAFRTVHVDQFRNGSFRSSREDTRLSSVRQPWRQGVLVRDRVNIRPTATSFKAAPDRRAQQPERGDRERTAVVRNNPGTNLRGQEHFTRITSPEAPSLPSRMEREQRDAAPDTGTRSAVRSTQKPQSESTSQEMQRPQSETSATSDGRRGASSRWAGTSDVRRENPAPAGGAAAMEAPTQGTAPARGTRNSLADSPEKPGGRRVATYRYMGTSDTTGEKPAAVQAGSVPETRTPDNAAAVQRGPFTRRSEPAVPEPKSGMPPASAVTRDVGQSQSGSAAPRSNSSRGWTYRNAMIEGSPREERAPAASSPESERATSYKATRAEREANSSALRKSGSSVEPSGNARSFTNSRSGNRAGSESSSTGKSGENAQSGRSDNSSGAARPRH